MSQQLLESDDGESDEGNHNQNAAAGNPEHENEMDLATEIFKLKGCSFRDSMQKALLDYVSTVYTLCNCVSQLL